MTIKNYLLFVAGRKRKQRKRNLIHKNEKKKNKTNNHDYFLKENLNINDNTKIV